MFTTMEKTPKNHTSTHVSPSGVLFLFGSGVTAVQWHIQGPLDAKPNKFESRTQLHRDNAGVHVVRCSWEAVHCLVAGSEPKSSGFLSISMPHTVLPNVKLSPGNKSGWTDKQSASQQFLHKRGVERAQTSEVSPGLHFYFFLMNKENGGVQTYTVYNHIHLVKCAFRTCQRRLA
jgi:hypothetical protein